MILLAALIAIAPLPPLPRPTPYRTVAVAAGVYVIPGDTGRGSEGRANTGFIVTNDGVIMIDAGGSPYQAKRLLASVRTITHAPVRWLILTHHHPDHSFGAIVFKRAGAQVIAHPDRSFLAAENGDDDLVANWDQVVGVQQLQGFAFADTPDVAITHDMPLTLGGRQLYIIHPPNAHTAGDLLVWVLDAHVLFAGDLVVEDGHTMVVDGSSRGVLSILEHVDGFPPAVVVPGHGRVAKDPHAQIALTRAYLDSARTTIKAALDNGMPLARLLAHMPPPDANRPVSLRSRDQRNAVRIYEELEKELLNPPAKSGLVSTDSLAAMVKRGGLTVIDVRTDISLYLGAHIPGAVYLSTETLRSFSGGLPNLLLPAESYVTLFTRLGIRPDRPVVVYSAGETRDIDATYVAWILDGFGAPVVSILDGGFQKWDLEQKPTERPYPPAVPGVYPSREFHPARATLEDVQRVVTEHPANTVLVDARPPDQYAGQAGAQMRRGHIPGAISHYWATDLTTGLTHVFKGADSLRAGYAAQGITPDKDVITYCNGGLESSHLYFVLHTLLGYPHVRVYDASWTEWAERTELPIESNASH